MDLLNRAAGKAFFYLVFIMSRDLMMSIARLLDKDVMRGKDNCTLSRLVKIIGNEAGKHDLGSTIEASTSRRVNLRCKPLVALRNQRLAHNDLATKLQDLYERESSSRSPYWGASR